MVSFSAETETEISIGKTKKYVTGTLLQDL